MKTLTQNLNPNHGGEKMDDKEKEVLVDAIRRCQSGLKVLLRSRAKYARLAAGLAEIHARNILEKYVNEGIDKTADVS